LLTIADTLASAPAVARRGPCADGEGIALQGVEVYRADRRVLAISDLSLQERRIGLIGNNGSGKSTLLRLMNGLLLPTHGQVTVRGLESRRHRKRLPAEVGFVFQNPDHQLIFPTVGEEIAFGLVERGSTPVAAAAKARAILDEHGCSGWEDRAVATLSGGQRQLVCVLAVIAPEPPIVLFDEPFASLDLPTRMAFARRLQALPQQIVMASHDFTLFDNFDRVIWLDDGAIRADGPPAEILPDYLAFARTSAGIGGEA